MQDTLKHLSRWMSSLLRHRAGEPGLRMDAAGWVELDELIAHLGEPRELVDEVVQQNNKTRFEVYGTRIRASQGHSLEGMPVTQEGPRGELVDIRWRGLLVARHAAGCGREHRA